MICPKCSDTMQTYERNGVHVDQCTACKGIFLDRGELEALSAAERYYYTDDVPGRATPAPPPPAGPAPPPRDRYGAPRERAPYDWPDERDRHERYPYESDRYRHERYRDDDRYRDDRHRKRKKKDFLDVLFDL